MLEWDVDTEPEEARERVAEAERILQEAREKGCAVSTRVEGRHVLDDAPFDVNADEYQIITPLAGG